jgi:hypothetical protein
MLLKSRPKAGTLRFAKKGLQNASMLIPEKPSFRIIFYSVAIRSQLGIRGIKETARQKIAKLMIAC